jgi:FkbM family methyltransferase
MNEIIRGESEFDQNRPEAALKIFQSILDNEPENIRALNDKGVALIRLGRLQGAVHCFETALSKQPHHADGVFNLISLCLLLKDWKKAEKLFSIYADALPSGDADIIARDIMDVKFSEEDTRAPTPFDLTVRIDSEEFTIRLFLDTEQYTQKIMWDSLTKNQIYEPELFKLLANVLKRGDSFIDIGAHMGYVSMIASKLVGETGRVVAVEPEVCNFAHMRKHIALNNIVNILAIQAAVGAESRETQLYINSDNDGGHALWNAGLHPYNQKTREQNVIRKVNMLCLDDIITQLGLDAVRAIKIDVEGAEMEVLKGGENSLIDHDIPLVICEINTFGLHQMGTSERELRHFMSEMGYRTYLMKGQSPNLIRLLDDQYVRSDYVFNVLFMKPEKE